MPPVPKADPAQPARDRLDYYAAVERELTRETWRWLRVYATERCAMLARAGLIRDADEILGDAVADVLEQRRPWVQSAISLRGHLRRQIKSRTHDLLEHAREFRHQQLDHRPGVADTGPLAAASTGAAPADAAMARHSAAAQFLAALYDVAAEQNDQTVVAVLDAFREGITRRSAVAEHVGIRVKQYDHARDRLSRMVKKLPVELTTDAREVMESWS